MKHLPLAIVVTISCAIGGTANAQSGTFPALENQERARGAQEQEQTTEQTTEAPDAHPQAQPRPYSAVPPRKRSWEAEPVYETIVKAGGMREAEAIGSYEQPRWSARRRFATTRIYVLPEGVVNFEYWANPKIDMNDPHAVRTRGLFELEFGLGHHLQLDVYIQTQQKGWEGQLELQREKVELRWAFADWGKIWGNPTLYLELSRQNAAAPLAEMKLLIGDQINPRWYWGANISFERELGGEHEHEWALTYGIGHALIDQVFSVGFEARYQAVDHDGSRFNLDEWIIEGGPSIQWRPTPPVHIDFVAMFGPEVSRDDGGGHSTAPIAEQYLIAGYEF